MNKNSPKIFEIVVDDTKNDEYGIEYIALVNEPATQEYWVAFNKQNPVDVVDRNVTFQTIDAEKRMIAGPLLIPNQLIVRYDDQTGEEYHMVINADNIRRAAKKFFKNKNGSNFNLDHDPNKKVNDVYIVESWFTTQNDKSKELGFNLPVDTWFAVAAIDNEDVWANYVKNNEVQGFSIEGLLKTFLVNKMIPAKYSLTDEEIQIKKALSLIKILNLSS